MINIESVRIDTPSSKNLIHFNNAGCALSPKQVTQSVIDYLKLEQEVGGYEAAMLEKATINTFYSGLATLLNCNASEIAFVENASRAWEVALHSIDWKAGDKIITAKNEYVSNYIGLLHLKKQKGVEIILAPSLEDGLIDLDWLESALKENIRLIALTHVASHRGDIQPARKVGELAKKYGTLYLLDACQSVGQINLDTQEIQCDFLCGTGRKFLRGPRGTGFLFASKNCLSQTDPVFLDNHSGVWTGPNSYDMAHDSTRFETWERSIASKIGLSHAIKYLNNLGIKNVEERVSNLANELKQKLSAIPQVQVFEKTNSVSGIITFQKENHNASQLSEYLRTRNVNTSVSKQDNARLDLESEGTGDLCRASIHYYNSSEEIDRFVTYVDQL